MSSLSFGCVPTDRGPDAGSPAGTPGRVTTGNLDGLAGEWYPGTSDASADTFNLTLTPTTRTASKGSLNKPTTHPRRGKHRPVTTPRGI